MLRKNNKNRNLELTSEAKERISKLQIAIDNFEDIALKYGPASAEELKNRINKIIRNFDNEFNKILETKFELFWKNQNLDNKSLNSDDRKISYADIPKFLRNYKK